MAWVAVADKDEVGRGRIHNVTVGNRQYIVCRTFEGDLRAMRAICPHRGAPLAAGKLCTMVTSEAFGAYELAEDVTLVRCPWHGIEFDLETGRAPADERLAAQTYAVREDDTTIYLELG